MDVYIPSDAVFHGLSDGGSGALGNHQNKRVLLQSLKKIAKKKAIFLSIACKVDLVWSRYPTQIGSGIVSFERAKNPLSSGI